MKNISEDTADTFRIRLFQKNTVEDHCRRTLQKITEGGHCRRSLQVDTAEDHCRRSLQKINTEIDNLTSSWRKLISVEDKGPVAKKSIV